MKTIFNRKEEVWLMYENEPCTMKIDSISIDEYGIKYYFLIGGLSIWRFEKSIFNTKEELRDKVFK